MLNLVVNKQNAKNHDFRLKNKFWQWLIFCSALVVISFLSTAKAADPSTQDVTEWTSLTIDNDIMVGGDGGYTNGLYLSWYQVGTQPETPVGLLVKPFAGWLNQQNVKRTVNIYSLGQAMVTPEDIESADYIANDLPYTGLLYFSNAYLSISEDYVDDVSVILGIVGPASGAEKMQRWVHQVTGSDEPRGWDNQTANELVFELKRGRTFRHWAATDDHMDFLTRLEASVGTLRSGVSSSAIFRWGKHLENSVGSISLGSSRTTNPLAIENSWYIFGEVSANYLAHSIFLDGNTFKNSNSVDYNRLTYGASVGLAFSFGNWNLTLAVANRDLGNRAFDSFDSDYYKFGTLTLAWKGQ